MAINPLIALQTQVPDLQPVTNQLVQGIQQGRERKERNRLLELSGVDNAAFNEGQVNKFKSVYQAALQLEPFIKAGDTQGAMSYLNTRREALKKAGIETSHTDSAIQALQQDPTGGLLGQQVSGIIGMAPKMLGEKTGEGFTLSPGQARFQGDTKIASLPESPSKGSDKSFDQAAKLRAEFLKNTSDFAQQNEALSRIVASAKDPSAAGDLALIFNFMKVLDPGSTVREGEFANAENSGSVPDRVYGAYNKVLRGERLSEEQRRDFVDRGFRLFEGATSLNQQRASEYTKLAESAGLNPADIVINRNAFSDNFDDLRKELTGGTKPKVGEQVISPEQLQQTLTDEDSLVNKYLKR